MDLRVKSEAHRGSGRGIVQMFIEALVTLPLSPGSRKLICFLNEYKKKRNLDNNTHVS